MAENPLQHMTEDELWSRYKKSKEPIVRDFFIRQYSPLVKYVAGKVAASMPNTVEFEDLVASESSASSTRSRNSIRTRTSNSRLTP